MFPNERNNKKPNILIRICNRLKDPKTWLIMMFVAIPLMQIILIS